MILSIRKFNSILLFVGLFAVNNSCSQTTQPNTKVLGVYIASTPCNKGSQPIQGIPQDSDCEFIKWNLTLYVNDKNEPTNYKLDYNYGVSQASTTGFQRGGINSRSEGKWIISKGSKSNPSAIIYQLDPDKPQKSISFVKLSNDLLHLLDSDRRLMIGNPGWSFTLNRVNQ